MDLKVIENRRETATVRSVLIEKPAGFVFKPGQFLSWKMDILPEVERGNRRTLSIAASPGEDYLMATTREGISEFKKKFDNLQVGDRVTVSGPAGGFLLDTPPDKLSVFITGGVGITPFRSMIKYATDTKSNQKIILFYSNQTPEEIVFKKELDEWQKINPNFKIIYTITRPEFRKQTWNGPTGRITKDLILNNISNLNDAKCYIAGPIPMVEAIKKILIEEMGVPDAEVKREKFTGY